MQPNSCKYSTKFYLALLCLVLFLNNSNAILASDFGGNCSSAGSIGPNPTSSSNDALYSYLQNNICISTTSCAVDNSNLTICVRNDNNTDNSCVPDTSCTEYNLSLNQNTALSSFTNNAFLSTEPNIKNTNVTVTQVDTNVCLMLETVFGMESVVCKTTTTTPPPKPENKTCTNVAPVCNTDAGHSKSIFNFSGRAIQCLRETLNASFFGNSTCRQVEAPILTNVSPFFVFQKSIRTGILAALVLYIAFFGIKLMYEPQNSIDGGQAIMFLLKLVLVQYFAIGSLPQYFNFGDVTSNGVTDIVMPLILSAISEFSNIMLQASSTPEGSNTFCYMDTSSYDVGYSYYALWDSFDCRVGYYLGYYPSDVTEQISSDNNFPQSWFKGNMAIFGLMTAATWMGALIVLICMLCFVVFLCKILFTIIVGFIMSILNLYILAYVSPIFITMYLFHYTKNYYEGWKTLLLSCCIQPLVLTAYLTMALTFFDQTVYKECEFTSVKSSNGNKYYVIAESSAINSDYNENCKSSIGYMMYKLAKGEGWNKKTHFLFSTYEFDSSQMASEIVYLVLFLVVFWFLLNSMMSIAESISGGVSIAEVAKGSGEDFKNAAQPFKDLAKGTAKLALGATEVAAKLGYRATKGAAKLGYRGAVGAGNLAYSGMKSLAGGSKGGDGEGGGASSSDTEADK
ncbi:MAG: type IV secretion system protein [Rickettsiaceae bacterium]|nr:type IV secretion system protein [Rickettsiaceae bacterium]